MTVDRPDGETRLQLVAGFVTAVGVAGLLVYPVHQYLSAGIRPAQFPVIGVGSILFTWLWATMVSWGVTTLERGQVRSLTPTRATLAPLLALVPFAVEAFRRPRTDVEPPPEYIRNWTPPTDPFDLLVRTFEGLPFYVVAPAAFLVVGVALARNQHRWVAGCVVALSLANWFHTTTDTALDSTFVGNLLRAALPGAILLYAGYRLAAERVPDGPESGADRPTET